MEQLNELEMKELIEIKLETTRAICNSITNTHLAELSEPAVFEFADIIELIAILMLEHAGEFPESWTPEKLIDVYHFRLPTLLEPKQRTHIKEILMTYLDFVGHALELPNYREIKQELVSESVAS